MDDILLFLVGFVVIVVEIIDALLNWLALRGLSGWLMAIGVFVLVGFHFVNKWSVEIGRRIHAIERKLGIEPPPTQTLKHPKLTLLFWFLVAIYVLGKSLQAEGIVFIAGLALSSFMLLFCAVCAYGLIDQAIRNSWRKKREWQALREKLYGKDKMD
jgi:hypothetical protein